MKSGVRRLATDAASATSGSILYSVFQTIALAIITRSGGSEDAALWFLGQAIATPIAALCSLRLRDQLAVEAAPSSYRHRLFRSWILSAIVGGAVTGLWVLYSSGEARVVGISILWSNLAQQTVQAFQGRRARSSDFMWPAQLTTLLGLINLGAVIVGYQRNGLADAMVIMAVLWWLVALVPTARELILEWRVGTPPRTEVSLAEDLGVGLSATSQNSQISVARIGAGAFAGVDALAAIGTASFFVRLGTIPVAGLRSAIAPKLAAARQAGTLATRMASMRARTHLFVGIGAIVGFGLGYAVGNPLIELMFGSEVVPERLTTGLVLMSAVFLYGSMILGPIVIAIDRRWALTRATISALIATALLIGPLAIAFGEAGAALTLGIGYLARYVFVVRALHDTYRPVDRRLLVLVLTPIVLMSLFAYWAVLQVLVVDSDDAEPPIDAIVVLAGGTGERLEAARSVLDSNSGAVLMLSVPDEPASSIAGVEVREICDRSPELLDGHEVRCFLVETDSTAGEAAAALTVARAEGYDRLVVVTNDFHSARARRWFSRCGRDVPIVVADSEFGHRRLRREWLATIDSILFQRSCPEVTRTIYTPPGSEG